MAAATALGKIDVTSNLGRKVLEKEAVQAFRDLENAENGFEPGLRFGQAMIDLRNSPGMKHGDWMPTLERLKITYRKAQYWMDTVKWQNGERPTSPKKPSVKMKKSGRFDWEAATDWLYHLRKRVEQLKRHRPQGVVGFAEELARLASDLQHGTKGEKKNALLQRKRPRGGSHIAAAHARRPHPAGGRR